MYRLSLHIYILSLSLLTLWSGCTPYYSVTQGEGGYLELAADSIAEDSTLEALILPYRAQLEAEMNRVLCTNDQAMVRDRPESALGNFVSELCLEQARTLSERPIDAALFNFGGLRSALPMGDITVEDIYQLMPFDNELVIVEIPSSGIEEMMRYLSESGGEPVADLELVIHNDSPKKQLIQGKTIEDRSYRILTSDYLARGGDRMIFLTQPERIDIEVIGLKLRDAILNHCEALGNSGRTINTQTDGRIRIEE